MTSTLTLTKMVGKHCFTCYYILICTNYRLLFISTLQESINHPSLMTLISPTHNYHTPLCAWILTTRCTAKFAEFTPRHRLHQILASVFWLMVGLAGVLGATQQTVLAFAWPNRLAKSHLQIPSIKPSVP